MTVEEYQRKKQRIDTIEKDVIKAEGSLETMMADLKKNFNVDSIEEAEKLIDTYSSEIKELDEDIKAKLDKLDTLTDWGAL
jgi:peptidoglycan hydrolase CwlO-like protein